MLDHLLLYRVTIVNLLGLLLVGYAYTQGWVEAVVLADHTGVVWVVIAFFLIFQASLWVRATKIAGGLNALKRGEVLNLSGPKYLEKMAHLEKLPGWIMLIGLIGNTLGIMLSIDNANLSGGDTQQSIVGLLGSMGVAFGATIVSGVLGIWAEILGTMVKTAAVCLIADDADAELEHRIGEFVGDMVEDASP